MSNLLEVIRTHSEERKASAQKAYRALVVNLAGDEDNASHPKADELLAIVEAAGRTVEQLEADVQRRKERLSSAALLKTLPGIEREKVTIENRINTLIQDRARIIQEYQAKISQQNRTLRGLEEQTRQVQAAQRHLEQTADQELLGQVRELTAQHGRLSELVANLERDLVEVEKVACRPMPDEPTPGDRRALGGNGGYLQEQFNAIDAERAAISRAVALRDQLRLKIDKERPRLEELAAQLKDLRASLLVP